MVPKVEPKFQAPFLGFTRTAEIWNSRACMIGLIGTFIVELVNSYSVLVFMVWYCEWRKLRKVLFLTDMFFRKFADTEQGNTTADWSGNWKRSWYSSVIIYFGYKRNINWDGFVIHLNWVTLFRISSSLCADSCDVWNYDIAVTMNPFDLSNLLMSKQTLDLVMSWALWIQIFNRINSK